jgi:hypothetical protein
MNDEATLMPKKRISLHTFQRINLIWYLIFPVVQQRKDYRQY